MPIFRIPYTVGGICYVQAANLDAAIDEVEYAPVSDVVESNYSECTLSVDDDYNAEEVTGIPASARLL